MKSLRCLRIRTFSAKSECSRQDNTSLVKRAIHRKKLVSEGWERVCHERDK